MSSTHEPEGRILGWLLAGDPAISWQAMAHLTDAPPAEVAKARSRIATEGWGARLLALQDSNGLWGNALYSPKWTSTTYTLLQLHWLGLPAGNEQAVAGCSRLWGGAKFYGGGLNLAKTIREPETCITSFLILLAASFGYDDPRLDPTVSWLLDQQLDDGGWNCESIRSGSRHGSFHTTISALDALVAYEDVGRVPVAGALASGQEFLLRHSLYRSHRTGQVVDRAFTRFPFPPQWHYDVLRGLDHFRVTNALRDQRLSDAIGVVRAARRSDGTWPTFQAYPGRQWFRMEERGPSRWTTLRSLRVLDWWNS